MGNFISYYMTSSLSPQEIYNYIHLSDVENHNLRPFDVETQTDKINFLDHEKESEVGFSILIPKHYNLFIYICLLYTSPSPRDKRQSRMPSSA